MNPDHSAISSIFFASPLHGSTADKDFLISKSENGAEASRMGLAELLVLRVKLLAVNKKVV